MREAVRRAAEDADPQRLEEFGGSVLGRGPPGRPTEKPPPPPCPRHPLSPILSTMRVHVLLFASYRDLAGKGELEIQLPHGATAERLIRSLRRSGEGFAGLPDRPAVAINREYASLGTILEEGDEVAILPPVAGG